MNKKLLTVVFLTLPYVFFSQQKQNVTKYVNPLIGTSANGHTFPGAALPFGMVQLSPDTYNKGWDYCSGYRADDNSIMGFTHTHLSGTGGADYGDILLMPTIGDIKLNPGSLENPTEGYRSKINHSTEKVSPGYYSVVLDDYKIKVELTATERAGFHKYIFPKSFQANIIIDLDHGISDETKEAKVEVVNNSEIAGYRRSTGWAVDHTVYFVAQFSKPFNSYGISVDGKLKKNGKDAEGKMIKAFVNYNSKKDEIVLVRIGISHTSLEGARKNLEEEISHWDFNKTKKNAEEKWNNVLSKIIVEGGTEQQRKVFYTSLYHTYLSPNILNDVDGHYIGMDKKIHTAKDFTMYTVFSLWDTFRALHPLFTIIEQDVTNDFVKTLFTKYGEHGLLPVWELASNETGTMIGYHSIPVIVDAFMKGIRNYNAEKIFEALKKSAEQEHLGLKYLNTLCFIPSEKEHEAVSKNLEYAYDNWCIAIMAKELGKENDYQKYSQKALSYIQNFDASTKFMRGKDRNGKWMEPFNPFEVTRDFTEANAWQYNLFVPHDVKGLENLFGGKEELLKRLNELFTTESKLMGRKLVDISGMIGQYAHGNEPSHHFAYLYTYLNEPWQTQTKVRQIMNEMYTDKNDGLCGNEDCGQMSAWYVFSAMGFYPACPGTNEYILGSPLFDKITINLKNGKQFVINAENNTFKNEFVNSVTLNNNIYNKLFIRHQDIMNGGQLAFEMSSTPNINLFVNPEYPYSLTRTGQLSIPYLTSNTTTFIDSLEITLNCLSKDVTIYFTLDGTEPSENSQLYKDPFYIKETKTIKAKAFKDGITSSPVMNLVCTKEEVLEARNISNLLNGLKYEYYEATMQSVFDILKLNPVKSGKVMNISLENAQIEDHYAFKFYGYIKVPEDGLYTFYTKSDDGTVLLIDDKEIVNNDGSHAELLTSGYVHLKKGFHKFTVLYFEDYEGQAIEVGMEGAGISRQPIPDEMLFTD